MWTVTFYSITFASLFWLVVNPPWKIAMQSPSTPIWGALVVLAVVSILVPHSLYFSGLRYVVPSRAIITSALEPVVAILSAALVLGESLDIVQAIGALFVILAIVLLQVRRESGVAEPSGTLAAEPIDAA